MTDNGTLSGLLFQDLFELFCWFCYQIVYQSILLIMSGKIFRSGNLEVFKVASIV